MFYTNLNYDQHKNDHKLLKNILNPYTDKHFGSKTELYYDDDLSFVCFIKNDDDSYTKYKYKFKIMRNKNDNIKFSIVI